MNLLVQVEHTEILKKKVLAHNAWNTDIVSAEKDQYESSPFGK